MGLSSVPFRRWRTAGPQTWNIMPHAASCLSCHSSFALSALASPRSSATKSALRLQFSEGRHAQGGSHIFHTKLPSQPPGELRGRILSRGQLILPMLAIVHTHTLVAQGRLPCLSQHDEFERMNNVWIARLLEAGLTSHVNGRYLTYLSLAPRYLPTRRRSFGRVGPQLPRQHHVSCFDNVNPTINNTTNLLGSRTWFSIIISFLILPSRCTTKSSFYTEASQFQIFALERHLNQLTSSESDGSSQIATTVETGESISLWIEGLPVSLKPGARALIGVFYKAHSR